MKPKMFGACFEFAQDVRFSDPNESPQMLEVSVRDEGAGKFFVIRTAGFAVDSGDDLELFLSAIRQLFGEAWNQ